MAFDVHGKVGVVSIASVDYAHLRAAGDHNCLFHAAGYALTQLGQEAITRRITPLDHATLRALVCNRIERLLTHEDTPLETRNLCRTHVYTERDVLDGDEHAQATAVTQYLVAMRTVGTWGDSLCVYAIEQEFGVRVEVFHLDQFGRVHVGNFPSRDADADHTIRLVTPPTGVPGLYNHFDPLVRNPPPLDAVPLVREDAPEKVVEGEAWRFWQGSALHLYEPAIAHSTFSDAWSRRAGLSFSLLYSNRNAHTIDTGRPTVLSTTLHSAATAFDSRWYRAKMLFGSVVNPDTAVDEPFTLTLLRDEAGRATEVIDPSPVTLVLAVQRFASLRTLDLTFEARTGKEFTPVTVSFTARQLAPFMKEVMKTVGDDDKPADAQTLHIPWKTLFAEKQKLLTAKQQASFTWEKGPYRVIASANGTPTDRTTEPAAWSWTYFHVPNAWDINTLPPVREARALLIDDDLVGLKTVAGAEVVQRTVETAEEVDLPAGVRDETDPVTSVKTPGMLERCIRGLGHKDYTEYDPNILSVLWERDDGTWDIGTSWASIAVLRLDAKSGQYHLQSLLTQGKRGVLCFSKATRTAAAALIGRPLQLLTLYENAVSQRNRETANQGIAREVRERSVERVKLMYAQILESPETIERLGGDDRVAEVGPSANPVTALQRVKEVVDALKDEVRDLRAPFAASSILKPSGKMEGATDFDYARNKERHFEAWDQYLLPPGMVVHKAVTRGISSCAGGVTYACDKKGPPSVIILWHIDASPSVPVKALIHQTWPDLAECPDLRTIAYVFPDLGEPNKYRPSMLYPSAIRDRCKTVFMARGPHLGVSTFNVGSGSDYFGLVAGKAGMDLRFTHDILKRTDMIGKRNNALTNAGLGVTLKAFQRDVFGTYQYSGIEVGHDLGRMREYVVKVASNDQEVKADKWASCHMCRLPSLGLDLFNAVDLRAKPLHALPCLQLGQKLELEFAGTSIDDVLTSRWTPGPVAEK